MVWKSTTADRSWSGLRYRARTTTACSLLAIAQAFRAWTEGLFQRLPKWLDNRPSSLRAVSSDISGKTGRLPKAQSALGNKPAEERVFRPTLRHLADRV